MYTLYSLELCFLSWVDNVHSLPSHVVSYVVLQVRRIFFGFLLSLLLQFQVVTVTLPAECVYVACRMMVAEYMRGLCTAILADSCCAR